MKDNILLLLTPIAFLAYLTDDMTIRQALEKMKVHGYTVLPVIGETSGKYIGSISVSDLLNFITAKETISLKDLEQKNITSIIREDFMPPMKVSASLENLVNLITYQNYVPIIDDRHILMGIVTRKSVINYLSENKKIK